MEARSPTVEPTEDRVELLLRVAAEYGVPLPVAELTDLLPAGGPDSAEALARWLTDHPHLGQLREGGLLTREEAPDKEVLEARRGRAERYVRSAQALFDEHLAAVGPWVRFAGVTGSAAFGTVAEGDDCDLFAIVRPGTAWLFLAIAFARLRTAPIPSGAPPFCLNHVLEEPAALREFRASQDLLFAREALSVRPIWGRAFYVRLLRSAPSLGEAAPRLYARWTDPGPTREPEGSPAHRAFARRLLNAAAFLPLAAFLQAKGLYANWRFRREGRPEACFRTVTRPDRMTFLTRKYERLRQVYASVPSGSGATGPVRPNRSVGP